MMASDSWSGIPCRHSGDYADFRISWIAGRASRAHQTEIFITAPSLAQLLNAQRRPRLQIPRTLDKVRALNGRQKSHQRALPGEIYGCCRLRPRKQFFTSFD